MGWMKTAQTFKLDKLPKVFVPGTKHYSWTKAGALLGLGQDGIVDVSVDKHGRMNVDRERLAVSPCQLRLCLFFSSMISSTSF